MDSFDTGQKSRRAVIFGFIVVFHIALIWALNSNLSRQAVSRVFGPIQTKIIEVRIAEAKPAVEAETEGGPSLQDPSFPPPPDISATGESASWTKEQFLTALTTGVRPDGRQMEPLHMPWTAFSHLTPMEQEAVFAFIRTVQ